jgi:hypothetical protein
MRTSSQSVLVSQQQALWDAAEAASYQSGYEFRNRIGQLQNVNVRRSVTEIVVERYLAAHPEIHVLRPL